MVSAHNPAVAPMREWKWSPQEKAVARRAFDLAVRRELDSLIREAKERAARITEASDLWELERWLGERRRQIDGSFDYRYSILPRVFAGLLRARQISEDDLDGLAPDKLDAIRQMATF
ncbi:MAG TPA: hypothetical protein VJS11_10430 [Acidobacteriaceae bacterium]|nr:hypothetical protein [Acidobacteriaceae bacterium]